MPPLRNSPYRMLVEGPDDKHAICNLLKRHGYDWDDNTVTRPYVEEAGGISELLDSTNRSADARTCLRLGVVLDADLNVTTRWEQVRGCFSASKIGIELPDSPASEGTIVEVQRPGLKLLRLGVWLMPDNQKAGILEDFLGKLVPAGDQCWAYADEVTSHARMRGSRLADKDHSKGRIHTWLAWQESPGLPFGTALTAWLLSHDSPEAIRFVGWFRRLFE